ncbi:hypothetical protein BH11MYX2_BH11MYX2_16450 [soil metagenome]
MSKDRARPSARKHRKYCLTVTGGMILIGGINVAIGMCVYVPARESVERIIPVLPPSTTPPVPRVPGQMMLEDLPRAVMVQFNRDFPRHAPSLARQVAPELFEISYVDSGVTSTVRYDAVGTRQP